MPLLELLKSQIALSTDELVKYGRGDSVLARYRTDEISRIGLEKTQEYGMPVVLIAVFGGLALASHSYVQSAIWSWAGIIVCLGVCGLTCLAIEGHRLVIETIGGTVRLPIADLFEDAEAFVLSASSVLRLEGFDDAEKTAEATSGD